MHRLDSLFMALGRSRLLVSAWRGDTPWPRWALGIGAGGLLWLLLLCSGISAALQSSTIAWPVPVPAPGAAAEGWLAGGWTVTSPFGWRDAGQPTGTLEFHDGVDLAGEPFCLRCPVPAIYDGEVSYVGWDQSAAAQPQQAGGGQIVKLDNGTHPERPWAYPEMRALFAHLEPYRLHLQLQGRIDDPWDQEAYRAERDYQPVGIGQLPDPGAGAILTSCQSATPGGKVPVFVWTRVGPGTYQALYDTPGSCTTTVEWPALGSPWQGWRPDGASTQQWRTPVEVGVAAKDIALRFRATIVPPPPLPTPTAVPATTPAAPSPAISGVAPRASSDRDRAGSSRTDVSMLTRERGNPCRTEGLITHCRWQLAAIPSGAGQVSSSPLVEPEMPTMSPSPLLVDLAPTGSLLAPAPGASGSVSPLVAATSRQVVAPPSQRASAAGVSEQRAARSPGNLDCGWQGLVALPGVSAPRAQLQREAAASFARVRAEIIEQTGVDALARLSEALRPADYGTDKPGVLYTSWHKAGRAIDLFVPYGGQLFHVVRDGRYFRIYIGIVDITAIFERHGWNRIPPQGQVLEWWHYEYRGDGISWQSAMLQIYTKAYLQTRLPQFNWDIGCTGGGTLPRLPGEDSGDWADGVAAACQAGVPSWTTAYEELPGCGPPVILGSRISMLDGRVGFVGMTGRTSGPHLHLGLQVRTAAVREGGYPIVDVCAAPWTPERLMDRPPEEVRRVIWQEHGQSCWTDTVDPLHFLPRAHGAAPLPQATAAPLIDEPYQLPPPGAEGALLQPVPAGTAAEESPGEYWSPHTATGRFGGGSILAWLCDWLAWLGYRPGWCA